MTIRSSLVHSCLVSYLFFSTTVDSRADDSFCVLIPDGNRQQIVQISLVIADDQLSLSQSNQLELPFGPNSITAKPGGKIFVVTSSAKTQPQVATVELQRDGVMRLLESSALSHPSGYTSIDRTGRYFLTVNYRSGMVAVYRIKKNGGIGALTSAVSTPNAEAHSILTSPDNRFAYVPCVKNNNALFQFQFDSEAGILSPLSPFDAMPPAMFGPRHVAFHPSLPLVYFSNEQQLGVSVYEMSSNGQLKDLQHATTIPPRSPYVSGKRGLHASDLVISRDGKHLFVAVRDFVAAEDSVFTFRVREDGKLSQIARSKVGDIPWKIALSPKDDFLFVSETGEQQLTAYKIESDGSLNRSLTVARQLQARDMLIE